MAEEGMEAKEGENEKEEIHYCREAITTEYSGI